MKKVVKFGVIAFIAVIILGVMFGDTEVEHDTKVTTPTVTTEIQEEVKEKIVYPEVTANDIITVYEGNELKADTMLKGKRGIIVGKVSNIERVFGQIYVTLQGDDEWALISVQCYFDDDKADTLTEISIGDTVKIEGTIEGKGWNVDVKDCVLR